MLPTSLREASTSDSRFCANWSMLPGTTSEDDNSELRPTSVLHPARFHVSPNGKPIGAVLSIPFPVSDVGHPSQNRRPIITQQHLPPILTYIPSAILNPATCPPPTLLDAGRTPLLAPCRLFRRLNRWRYKCFVGTTFLLFPVFLWTGGEVDSPLLGPRWDGGAPLCLGIGGG